MWTPHIHLVLQLPGSLPLDPSPTHPWEEQSHPQDGGTWPCPITDPMGLVPPVPAKLQSVPLLAGEKYRHGSASSGHTKV